MKALVTGATSGIGKEIAVLLAEKNIDLVIASRNDEEMKNFQNIYKNIANIDYISIDLSKPFAAKKLFEIVKSRNHRIDILVNNSGFGLYGETIDFDEKLIEGMVLLNCAALTSLSRLFGKDMAEKGKGYILNVASTAAFQPIPYFAVYSATKSFVFSFSKALHHELKNYGVGVTCLNPGPTSTNFHKVALGGGKFKMFKGKKTMTAAEVARIGVESMFSRKVSVTAGILNKIYSVFLPLIPLTIVEKFLRKYVRS